MKKTRVMIVDDHSVVRMGLTAIINLEDDLTVCGEAESGEEAVRLAPKSKPDVVVMDLKMTGMDGAETTAELQKVLPAARVLILTTFGDSTEIARALAAGAVGAVTKNISNTDLAGAIRDTAAGKRHLSSEIARTLESPPASATPSDAGLTERQMVVLDYITRGLSNDDIARLLDLSKARVKQHLNSIYEKLGAANRAEAVAIALRKHLLKI